MSVYHDARKAFDMAGCSVCGCQATSATRLFSVNEAMPALNPKRSFEGWHETMEVLYTDGGGWFVGASEGINAHRIWAQNGVQTNDATHWMHLPDI